ncbi:MAG: SBBP repeat-containing protein [Bacteroidia bacterium]
MKSKLTLLVILLSVFLIAYENGNAQSINYQWAKSAGGTGAENSKSITVDANENSYITGGFASPSITFGGITLTNNGSGDIFIVKYDSSGNVVWAKNIGGSNEDEGRSIAIDAVGNVYTTGFFKGTVDFDPGSGVYNLSSTPIVNDNIFISKLDFNGNFIWAKSFGGYESSITCDPIGNVFATGSFSDTVDFDPGPAVYYLNTLYGNPYIFVSKLDSSGNFIWAKAIGDSSGNGSYSKSIAIDGGGNVYTTGIFNGTVDFDPSAGTYYLPTVSSFDESIFISKLDSNGNFIWAKGLGGTNVWAQGISIAVDVNENAYTTGGFDGTVDFDPGPGVYSIFGPGDIFISKLDPGGNFVWAKTMGHFYNDAGYSIKIDDNGNVYTTGVFQDTVDFDPGPGIYNLWTLLSGDDIFISKLDSNGSFVWAKSIGSSGADWGYSLALDAAENVFITGFFNGTVDFNPPLLANLTSNGNQDIFIAKYSECSNTSATQSITACNSYTWIDGNTYNASNNTATFTLINAAGCDSVITLNLTINQSTTSTDVIIACNTYIWIDGNTYTANNNTATYTLTNAAGCDSIITLNLTINPAPVALFTIYPDTTTAHNWFALNQCTGIPPLTYVWNWGDSSAVSTGATPVHLYTDSGFYNICVTVTDSNGCSNTYCDSSTYIYKGTNNSIITLNVVMQLPTGIAELNATDNGVTIYPNPANEYITIGLPGNNKKYQITITDITGKIIYTSSSIPNQKTTISTKDFPQGVYAVSVQTADFIETRKVIVVR